MDNRSKQARIVLLNLVSAQLLLLIAAGLYSAALILSKNSTLRRILRSDTRSVSGTNQNKGRIASICKCVSHLRNIALTNAISAMSLATDNARRIAVTLAHESLGGSNGAKMARSTASALSGSKYVSGADRFRTRKVPPLRIDVTLANRNRALESLPEITGSAERCSIALTSPSNYTRSVLDYASRYDTPLHDHIRKRMRSPATSTPCPTSFDHDECEFVATPDTAVFSPETPSTTTFNNTNSSSTPSSIKPTNFKKAYPDFIPTDFYTRMQTSEFPYTRSKRLERMLINFVEPLDTDVSSFQVNAKWWRVRTPIQGRWELFQRSTQVKFGRLMERAWLGVDVKSGGVPGGLLSEDTSGDERLSCESSSDDGYASDEESGDGWGELPTPISPLCGC